jgi:hypothetical protein
VIVSVGWYDGNRGNVRLELANIEDAIRQPRVGDWDSAIHQVARALSSALINIPAAH